MLIKRTLFPELKGHLDQKEITLIVGPRQTGKTTLMLFLREYLEKAGKKTVFFNLDIEKEARLFENQERLVKQIELEFGNTKGYVFIDEIQRKESAGLFLKGIYDMNLPHKFIVSGSGSLELKEKIHESLAGRKRVFELNTLSFEELIDYKTNYRYSNDLKKFLAIDPETTNSFLEEYLNFGGYPKVVLEENLERKTQTIKEIYQSYLEKDISYFLKLKKTEEFTNLVRIIASQIGNLVNFTELSSTLSINVQTVKNYLWYLEKTFLIKKINPYYRNLRKEIAKSPAFYFHDLGLRNYILGVFGNLDYTSQDGFLFQNFIFKLIQEKTSEGPQTINFWRSKNGAEVDFVITKGLETTPVEVKLSRLEKPEIPKSLRSFIAKYNPKKAWLVNLNFNGHQIINSTNLQFIPYYRFLFEKLYDDPAMEAGLKLTLSNK